jgi:hypothetical protein
MGILTDIRSGKRSDFFLGSCATQTARVQTLPGALIAIIGMLVGL